jgi:predicted metal-dependent peptidase
MVTREDSLSRACKSLMVKEPFYGLFLIMLNKEWKNSKVSTACVSKNGINYQLTLNEDFWVILNEAQQRGLLKHELLHIVFFHVLINHMDFPERDILALAVDLEVNQYIDDKDLPPNPILLKLYPELQLDAKAGFRYYYEKLKEGKEDGNCPGLNDQLAAMAARDGIGIIIGPNGEILPDHNGWKDFEDLSEAEKGLIKKQADYQLQEAADQVVKSRGTVPAELAEYIRALAISDPPKFDWRSYVRRFAGGSTKIYTKKLRRKFNKRFDENPGLKIKPKRHVLVAVDTSGSVSSKELQEFFHEIHHIHKTGTEVTVVQADAAISHIAPYKKGQEIKVHGRGGTDFSPVIDYYSQNLHKFTCLIYFTDGEAPAPSKAPRRVLWVLSSTSAETDHLPGNTIQLN